MRFCQKGLPPGRHACQRNFFQRPPGHESSRRPGAVTEPAVGTKQFPLGRAHFSFRRRLLVGWLERISGLMAVWFRACLHHHQPRAERRFYCLCPFCSSARAKRPPPQKPWFQSAARASCCLARKTSSPLAPLRSARPTPHPHPRKSGRTGGGRAERSGARGDDV